MASFTPEIAYTFRRYEAVMTAVAPNDDTGTLAAIESLLLEAAGHHRARQYDAAVRAYTEARRLIWSQLAPSTRWDSERVRTADVLRSLVSYSAEWMNVLPVEQVASGVRPREVMAVDAGPLVGLHSAKVDAQGLGAVADIELARTLDSKGNAGAAKFFRDRALATAPDLARAVDVAAPVDDDTDDGVVLRGAVARSGAVGALRAESVRDAVRISDRFSDITDVTATVPVVQVPPALTVEERTYSFARGDTVKDIAWSVGEAPAVDTLLDEVYKARIGMTLLPDVLIAPQRAADVAVGLAHAWYYETQLGLAECFHAMGEYGTAEGWYLGAARYQYLNAAVEAPYVWTRLANLYLDWGNSAFRDDDAQTALGIYQKVLGADGTEPATPLYTLPGLAPAAAGARDVIAHLDDASAVTASPTIAAVIFDIHSQLAKIGGGLDFWGHWAANVPIWTFDYLQSVSANFCQLAISAERDAMTFWEKADSGQLTRTQLTQNIAQAKAEREAANRQVDASNAELSAFAAGQQTAALRATNARKNADEYADKSWDWTLHQAQSAQLAGGSDGNSGELNRMAERIQSGPYSFSGERGTLSAAEQLAASRIQRDYEIDSMRRQAAELDSAAQQAVQETKAAQAHVVAAMASANAANVRVDGAQQLLAAFDDQRFTPDVWNQLGEKMDHLSQRYLGMALDVAKRMQRAYNFENDTALAVIKADYTSDTVQGMLAADTLMADVQAFTYDLVTSTAPKSQPVRQTISLAQRYPFLFETQFRTTGHMEFDTRLDDFDEVYPGTYAGRIENVEVDVDGIVPARGISGALTNAGISHYRMPSSAWGPGDPSLKHRVQNRETLVLSDYDVRADALVVTDDSRRRRIFEGAGVASSWTLDVPKSVNDLDFDGVTDVRLTFTYQARFDPDLRDRVLTELASHPQVNERQRPVPLRWLFPDAFFSFYGNGILSFSLDRGFFPLSERDPVLTGLSLVGASTPRARLSGTKLAVTAPGKAPVAVTVGADGSVAADDLAAAAGGSALGEYRIVLAAADNPSWVTDGQLDLDAVDNISLILGYSFTPRS